MYNTTRTVSGVLVAPGADTFMALPEIPGPKPPRPNHWRSAHAHEERRGFALTVDEAALWPAEVKVSPLVLLSALTLCEERSSSADKWRGRAAHARRGLGSIVRYSMRSPRNSFAFVTSASHLVSCSGVRNFTTRSRM